MQHTWGDQKCIQHFGQRKLKGRDHLGDQDIDGRIILKLILDNWIVDWILLAQESDQWQAVVNTAMNLRVPYREWNLLTS
jgi:hypothetical protein